MKAREKIKELEEVIHKLRIDNLMMRLDFEILIQDINSRAAQKILEKYKQKRREREESDLMLKN